MPEPERFVTVKQTAEMLGATKGLTYWWIEQHMLRAYRFGRMALRLKPSDVQQFLQAKQTTVER
jgi:excisionase family DNA binding protein